MATYTVHAPPASTHGKAFDASRMIFVRDGFSWAAFLVAPVWLVFRRLWVELAVYCLAMVGLGFVGASRFEMFGAALSLGIALLLGLEASSLRRAALARRGYAELGLVEAASREEAEIRYFLTHPIEADSDAPAAAPPHFARPAPQPGAVIGLFPNPGASR